MSRRLHMFACTLKQKLPSRIITIDVEQLQLSSIFMSPRRHHVKDVRYTSAFQLIIMAEQYICENGQDSQILETRGTLPETSNYARTLRTWGKLKGLCSLYRNMALRPLSYWTLPQLQGSVHDNHFTQGGTVKIGATSGYEVDGSERCVPVCSYLEQNISTVVSRVTPKTSESQTRKSVDKICLHQYKERNNFSYRMK